MKWEEIMKVLLIGMLFSFIGVLLYVLSVEFGPEVFGVVYILVILLFGLYLLRLKRLENSDE